MGLVPALEQLVPEMSLCPDFWSFIVALVGMLLPVILIVNELVPVCWVTGVAAVMTGQFEFVETTRFTVVEELAASAAFTYGELDTR